MAGEEKDIVHDKENTFENGVLKTRPKRFS